jgi:hypothetical protein
VNIVLYTDDFEPITILDLPLRTIEIGRKSRMVHVPVRRRLVVGDLHPDAPIRSRQNICTIEFQPLIWRRGEEPKWVMTTRDEELALLLRPGWLPGQQGAINQLEERAKLNADFVAALVRTLGGDR